MNSHFRRVAENCADMLRALSEEAEGLADTLDIDENKALFLLTQIYVGMYGGKD